MKWLERCTVGYGYLVVKQVTVGSVETDGLVGGTKPLYVCLSLVHVGIILASCQLTVFLVEVTYTHSMCVIHYLTHVTLQCPACRLAVKILS